MLFQRNIMAGLNILPIYRFILFLGIIKVLWKKTMPKQWRILSKRTHCLDRNQRIPVGSGVLNPIPSGQNDTYRPGISLFYPPANSSLRVCGVKSSRTSRPWRWKHFKCMHPVPERFPGILHALVRHPAPHVLVEALSDLVHGV